MTLTYREVAEIMKIIDASSMEEVILEVNGAKLVVRRGTGGARAATASTSEDRFPASPAPAPPAAATPAAAVPDISGDTVRSPMVGTFYRAPSPGEPPFVEEGGRIETGDPLCLIEVMKLYTTIEAPRAGTIKRILAEDADLVEFDQPLFVIE